MAAVSLILHPVTAVLSVRISSELQHAQEAFILLRLMSIHSVAFLAKSSVALVHVSTKPWQNMNIKKFYNTIKQILITLVWHGHGSVA